MPITAPARSPAAPRGRPREFDPDDVLDRAIAVFSARGYHASSIGELSAATGLTAGSLYKAFRDKRGLFVATLARYKARRDAALDAALAPCTNARERIRTLLAFYAEASSGAAGQQGCLVVSGATELAVFDAELADQVNALLRRVEVRLLALLRAGQDDGSIAPLRDSEATARTLLCLVQGLRVVGKTRRTLGEMLAVVDVAMGVL